MLFAFGLAASVVLSCATSLVAAQTVLSAARESASSGPPSNPAFFPLSQVRAGMMATAWTVFQGTKPEPMQVEILGVLRGVRGPGQDLILARLRGEKPEYTGVVAGMSGSPVYIDGKLIGALSYRIGLFTKEPIAGITPIEQMIEVRDLSMHDGSVDTALAAPSLTMPGAPASAEDSGTGMTIQPMETPLVISGLDSESIRFWQTHTAGTSLETIAAGGSSVAGPDAGGSSLARQQAGPVAGSTLVPGSAVSMELVRGDIEIAATCTVTYIDPKQLLACGHPVLGAGPVSLPMTATDVVATVASPLNAFKVVNTGATIGAFDEDRESAIRGVIGEQALMIPMHIAIDGPTGPRKVNVEILDLPSLTPVAMQVVLLQALTATNASSDALSYHLTGSVTVANFGSMPLDIWAPAGAGIPATLQSVLAAGQQFTQLYANGARQGTIRAIYLHVQAIPERVGITLEQAHIVSSDLVHAGDTVEVEAMLQPWQQPERNIRIAFKLPARLAEGNVRLLVSDAATLDRALYQTRLNAPPPDVATVVAEARSRHPADRIYVTLLAPDAQGEMEGQPLTVLPLSMANAMEPLRNTQNASLNGESAELAGDAPVGGVLSGFEVLNLHIEPGGGLN